MNPIFTNLSAKTLSDIEDHLTNDLISTDEELWDLFIEDLDLAAEQADAAVELRPKYLKRLYLKGYSPLFENNAVWFDPKDKTFKSNTSLTSNC